MRIKPGTRQRRQNNDRVEIVDERGIRTLHLGNDAIQSAMRIARPWELELAYTRAMMGCLLFNPQPQDVLMIGLGGGSLARFMRKYLPDSRITAVEIDADVIHAARAHFALPPDDATLAVIEADGALYVRQHACSADVILLDGFDGGNQVEALASATFYAACRRALKPNGVLVVNLWGRDPQFQTYFSRLLQAFDGQLGWLSVTGRTNVVAFAFTDPDAAAALAAQRSTFTGLSAHFGLDLGAYARDMQWPDATLLHELTA
jgi:spermidine synthase